MLRLLSVRIPCIALQLACCTLVTLSQQARAQALGCLVTPSNVIELGSPAIGIVQQIHVERGEVVAANQVLATLRADLERANYDLASTRADAAAELQASSKAYEFAQRKFERTKDLFRQEFVSTQAVDQARADLEAADARKAQAFETSRQAKKELLVAAAQLGTRTLRSPIAGVVLDVYRRSGERVEDRPIMKIATLDPLHVELVLPAAMFGRVKPGAVVTVQPGLAGVAPASGVVRIADKVIDPASGTFRARVVLANPDGAIPAGIRCQATFAEPTPPPARAASPGAESSKLLP